MTICYVGLGSNQGNRREFIRRALRRIAQLKGTRVLKVSAMLKSAPQGGPKDQPEYLNAAAKVSTGLSAGMLLRRLKAIERALGRVKTRRWGPRVIDLDILFFGSLRLKNARLTIPHPRIFMRDFVKEPLSEIIW